MEYYSAIRKDEYPPFALTWMELEGIMLNEISQAVILFPILPSVRKRIHITWKWHLVLSKYIYLLPSS